MSGDLESFLRQAAQRKPIQPPPQEVVEIIDDEVEIIEAEVLTPLASRQSTSAAPQADPYTSEPHRLGSLGSDRTVDEVAELDHKLGSLESTLTATDDMLEEAAAKKKPKIDIRKMFTAEAVTNSVIVSEVLKRPDW